MVVLAIGIVIKNMGLINCPHCKHKVSEDALTCPNCNKPLLVLSDRACNDCGERIPKRKRKCPNCGCNNSTNINKQKTKNMAGNSSSKFLIIIVVLALLVAAYFYINKEETTVEEAPKEMVIPDGMYKLTNARRETAALCNLSFLNYGKVITISGKKAYTTMNLVQEITYDVINKGGNAFQIGPASVTCFYTDNKITFSCQGEDINYVKE